MKKNPKSYEYHGATILCGPYGWFVRASELNPNLPRWGNSPNMGSDGECEMWIDEKLWRGEPGWEDED